MPAVGPAVGAAEGSGGVATAASPTLAPGSSSAVSDADPFAAAILGSAFTPAVEASATAATLLWLAGEKLRASQAVVDAASAQAGKWTEIAQQ
jgi:hypothetical protein